MSSQPTEAGAAADPGQAIEPKLRARGSPRRPEVALPRILSITRARTLIWATPPGERLPFEVSKGIGGPLQPRCPTAPLCPAEQGLRGIVPGWADPESAPAGACPYSYETRGECVRSRNVQALELALFLPHEARLATNYLRALGYSVRPEEVVLARVADGSRVLAAHGKVGDGYDVRVLASPCGGELVLVRDLGPRRRRLPPSLTSAGAPLRAARRSGRSRAGRRRADVPRFGGGTE